MTQEQIIGSKLIALFMGGKLQEMAEMEYIIFSKTNQPFIHQLQYHTSWEWLMPVVEKIESLPWITVRISRTTAIYKVDIQPSLLIGEGNKTSGTLCKIENVYTAVVQFITWHNEQLASVNTENIFNEAAAQFPNTLKKLPDTELPEMHILYNPSSQKEYHEEQEQRTLDREEMTKTEAAKRNAVLRDSGSDNRWILDIGKARV